MLSHTQRWRHLKSRSGNRHRRQHEEQYLQHNISPLHEHNIREYVENEQIILPIVSSPKSNQTEFLTESKPASLKTSRKVKFNPVIRVCLVPCRADFRGNFNTLFWGRDDYQCFKEDALRELREHWLKHHTSVKEAIYDLYQPAPIKEPQGTAKLLTHVDSVAHLSVMANLNKQLTEEAFLPSTNATCTNINMSGISAHDSVHKQGTECMEPPLHIGDIRTGQAGSTPVAVPALSATDSSTLGGSGSKQVHGHHRHEWLPVEDGESAGLLEIFASTTGDEASPTTADTTTAVAGGTPGPNSSTAQIISDNKLNHSQMISVPNIPSSVSSTSEEGDDEPYDNITAASSPPTLPPHNREHISTELIETKVCLTDNHQLSEELVTIDSASLSAPPLHNQQQQLGSRDNGNNGNTVRMRLLEDSPCSSVSSFEPPILIC